MKNKVFTPTIVLPPLPDRPVLSSFTPTGTYYDFLLAHEKFQKAKVDFKNAADEFDEAFRKFHGYEQRENKT